MNEAKQNKTQNCCLKANVSNEINTMQMHFHFSFFSSSSRKLPMKNGTGDLTIPLGVCNLIPQYRIQKTQNATTQSASKIQKPVQIRKFTLPAKENSKLPFCLTQLNIRRIS